VKDGFDDDSNGVSIPLDNHRQIEIREEELAKKALSQLG
jgi:hypothetical protein